MKKDYNGIIDLGTLEQKQKLYSIQELVSTPMGSFLNKTNEDLWTVYPRRSQDRQSSCVYHARAKMAGALRHQKANELVVYSAADYNKRSNAPAEGAYPVAYAGPPPLLSVPQTIRR